MDVSGEAIDAQRRASDATVAWCLRHAAKLEKRDDIERAATWAYVAAGTASEYGHSWLTSAPLESMLQRIGSWLPHAPASPTPRPGRALRWLHVFSMTFTIGGHTALARRWIARNPFGERHSVALTMQPGTQIEAGLATVVRTSGGNVHSLVASGSLLQRASALRRLAYETADVVALHTHPWDVVPSLAFAVPGGPSVLLIDHADHAFWTGCGVADVVVDIRDSGLWLSNQLRGVRSSALLPIPLEDRGPAPRTRSLAAARLADPSVLERKHVLLTIGSGHKYLPHPTLNFAEACSRIVHTLDDCILIVVGPQPGDPPWHDVAATTNGRVIAVGSDPDLVPWHAAADVYLEGFPVGSYTALLEVVLAERPVVRKPWLVSPSVLPVDRGSLAAIEAPNGMDRYVEMALALCGNRVLRDAQAVAGRSSVLAWHCGVGWHAQLGALRDSLPREHGVGLGSEPAPIPQELARYRSRIGSAGKLMTPLAFAQKSALENGLNARTDIELVDALRYAERSL